MAIKMSQGLKLKQSQNMMMTPQLQQAIKLLTLTHLEMTNVISQEMNENPMLETQEDGSAEDKFEEDYKVEKLEMQNQEATSENFEAPAVFEKDDFDWNSYIENSGNNSYSPPNMAAGDPDDLPNYENMVSKGMTLPEHLEWQLRMDNLNEAEWNLAEMIIHNLDAGGYLDTDFEEIIAQSGIARDDAFAILEKIKRLDPVGCGSTNLIECLLVQANILDPRSPLVERLITDHLEDLQKHDYENIYKKLGVVQEKIKEAELIIHTFHPRPGRLVGGDDTQYVVPDIFVVEVAGDFVVQINDEGVPRLKISNLYKSMMQNKNSEDNKAKEYVQDKLRSAMWLIKSIQNRQRTIEKVANAIVRQQKEFFKKGPQFLKPMILKNIAEEIGMHESTVSRVTTNKFMHTPIGVFELKYFFNAGIGGKDGGIDISGEVLKIKIKQLVDNESPKRPLSDQKIAELLSREDVAVARRTVAKYREIMGIASSSQRKAK